MGSDRRTPRPATAVVVAAGRGRRSGLGFNKAFYGFRGRFVVETALKNLSACPEVRLIVLVLNRVDLDRYSRRLKARFPRLAAIVEGGKERGDSVFAGLKKAGELLPTSVVLIHDAARPFVSRRIVRDCLRLAGPGCAAVPGLGVANTLKKVVRGEVLKTIDRSALVEVQTPQTFVLQEIIAAYSKPGRKKATDDCQVFEAWGGKVRIIPGSIFNFKVTWPEDLLLYRILSENGVR